MKLGFIGLGSVIDTAWLPALQRLNISPAQCFGFDVDAARAPAGITRCDSLEALLATQPDMVLITTASLAHLPAPGTGAANGRAAHRGGETGGGNAGAAGSASGVIGPA